MDYYGTSQQATPLGSGGKKFESHFVLKELLIVFFFFVKQLNQTISSLYGGVVPHQLYSLEQFASASLFERRLDIFIPLILVAAICFMVLAVSLVCIRAKTKSMATWDPPAGVVFGKVLFYYLQMT